MTLTVAAASPGSWRSATTCRRSMVALVALATVGIVLAHIANNLMNDLFDLEVGTDSETYPRALYAPHPVLSGMITPPGPRSSPRSSSTCSTSRSSSCWSSARGWPVVAFALGGFLALRRLHRAAAAAEEARAGRADGARRVGPADGRRHLLRRGRRDPVGGRRSRRSRTRCCAPTVLMGKHIDKIPWDEPDGTRTLPVILGERARPHAHPGDDGRRSTRRSRCSSRPDAARSPSLVVRARAAEARRGVEAVSSRPKPDEPPAGFPIWPLWFAALAFVHTRRAGGLLVLGLAIGALGGLVRRTSKVRTQGDSTCCRARCRTSR